KATEPDREVSETIRVVKIQMSEAVEQVMRSEITHAASCYLILKAERILKQPKAASDKAPADNRR
ncbi:MAG TPA: hypothetical protein VGO69_05350, partial [Pyrinomonadaceae bacterium]|nr:hypothetical protein [Pyrinomonadaceae bacterium]